MTMSHLSFHTERPTRRVEVKSFPARRVEWRRMVVSGRCGALEQGDVRRRELDQPPGDHVSGVIRIRVEKLRS